MPFQSDEEPPLESELPAEVLLLEVPLSELEELEELDPPDEL